MDEAPLLFRRIAWRHACRGNRPRVDHWVGPAVGAVLNRGDGVELSAGRVETHKPGNSVRGVDAAHQREYKGLRHAHDRELHVRITSLGSKSSSIGHAYAEPVGIDRGEQGVHV